MACLAWGFGTDLPFFMLLGGVVMVLSLIFRGIFDLSWRWTAFGSTAVVVAAALVFFGIEELRDLLRRRPPPKQ